MVDSAWYLETCHPIPVNKLWFPVSKWRFPVNKPSVSLLEVRYLTGAPQKLLSNHNSCQKLVGQVGKRDILQISDRNRTRQAVKTKLWPNETA